MDDVRRGESLKTEFCGERRQEKTSSQIVIRNGTLECARRNRYVDYRNDPKRNKRRSVR